MKRSKEVRFEKQIKFIRTNEDWYPAYPPLDKQGDYESWNPLNHKALKVTFVELYHKIGEEATYRVSVWGCDDYGMEYDTTDRSKAWELYELLEDYITKKDLKALGFECA